MALEGGTLALLPEVQSNDDVNLGSALESMLQVRRSVNAEYRRRFLTY
jgi:hypothetical protein